MLLSVVINTKYQCSSAGCSPSSVVSVSSLRNCQFVCLTDIQCRTITFDQSNNQCEVFSDIPSQYGQLLVQTGVVTMTAIDERQLSAPTTTSTTTTSTTSTSTSSTSTSTTTTSSTSTSSTTTISPNPCVSGILWNTTAITVLGSSPVIATSGVYVDSNNTLYAVDENSNYVVWKLLKDAVNATIIAGIAGSSGSSSNQLSYPNDVYTDRNGNVYVSDCYNHRIQKYVNGSPNGTTIAGITQSAGSSVNQFNTPRYLAFDSTDTYMYVADYSNHRIVRYSTNSTSGTNGTVVAGGNGGNNINTSLNAPWGIHYLSPISNDIFITNYAGHSVMRWTPGAPSGVFVAGTPGVLGSNSTLLNYPSGIKIDTYLNMYVVDNSNHRVQMFCANSRSGITIAETGSSGNGATQLYYPRGIVFDAAMNMYIGDTNNHRVQKFLKL